MRDKVKRAAYMRQYRKKRPGESTKYSRAWAKKHPERHKQQQKESALRRKENNPRGYFGWHLRTKYSITVERYEEIFKNQDGLCAICRRPPKPGKRLNVDHDHKCCAITIGAKRSCGKCVRGLLCDSCNYGIGLFKDDVTSLRMAIEYLERHVKE